MQGTKFHIKITTRQRWLFGLSCSDYRSWHGFTAFSLEFLYGCRLQVLRSL
ncbi:hypothetical protein [Nostoc sp. NIES-3756]|uniref:hypothetical protein n=1 Tax=Nostoc sp. NIES-3756 TaxID=1751286 RepID=UPI000B24DE81|nr:hypothetical protein [Nostoc sp. NIES-3756]